ncbi:MAG: response regulator [Nitrospirota bacterium]
MKFNILLAGQDKTILNLLKQRLSNKGFEVFNVTSAKGALKIAKKLNIHIAVIDMTLSDTQGIELIPRLKELHPNIRVIFTTSEHSTEIETSARKEGIILYMPKPLDLRLIEKAISKGLRG